MADIRCPICDRPNDANAERCWYCQAVLPHEAPTPINDPHDWLEGLRDDTDKPGENNATPDSPNNTEPPEEEVPDWLARIRLREQEQNGENQEPQAESSSDEPAIDIPDRLTENEGSQDTVQSPQNPEPAKTPAFTDPSQNTDDNEDWLKQLGTWQPGEAAAAENELTPIEPDEPSQTNLPGEAVPADSGATSDNDSSPDWLSAFIQESDTTPPAQEEPTPEPPISAAPEMSQTFSSENEEPITPEPTPSMDEPVLKTPEINEPEAASEPIPSNESPAPQEENWLSAFRGIQPDEDLAGQVIPPPANEDLPKVPFSNGNSIDWLEPAPAQPEPGENEPAKKLEPAALPAWLLNLSENQNNRSNNPPDDDTSGTENSGPLSGIEGALQGEELSQYYTPPQTYNGSLKISAAQQDRSQILKNIADQARWEDEGLGDKPRSYQWVVRLIVSILILVAVLVPIFYQKMPNISPSLYPDEVVQTFNTVNALAPAKPVLVAADFDGSLYGELNWTLQPLFTQLLAKNIPIAYLSTNSVGATLMSQSLDQLVQNYPAYIVGDSLINLGYLAGGSIGMQSLARDPLTALPLNSELHSAWQSGPLSTIKKLSDFGALIVITENADTARYWIEQVKPTIGATPMLVVISAQSAPLLQPYYNSGQINGYLSGLYSAAVYEFLIKDPQTAQDHLSSYQLTLLLVTFMVLIGGVVSLILHHPAPAKSKGKTS
ncbi:MAG: hypothetical protein AB9897_04420 [Anaerolineaceae bacterium]